MNDEPLLAKNEYLASKTRYEALDGLRGVAAVLVVIFHILEAYQTTIADHAMNHGYLAVDFFYILSGFVIGYAYDDRWDRMSIWTFFKRRLVRLHPMVVMGTTIGLCLYFFGADAFPMIGTVPGWKIMLGYVMCLLMIPLPPSLDARGWMETNPFDGPCWSLTYEYLANILYAFLFRFLPTWGLIILVLCSCFLTCDLCLNLNVFKILTPERIEEKYTVIGGWCLTGEQIYIAMTRLLAPFLIGLLIYRTGFKIQFKYGFIVCSLILIADFFVPCVGGADHIANGFFNVFSILIVFPFVILLGVGSPMHSDSIQMKICKFLGDISYPLYITHYPIMYMQMSYVYTHPRKPYFNSVMVNLGVIVFAFIQAYLCMKTYDAPVREWLTKKLFPKKN